MRISEHSWRVNPKVGEIGLLSLGGDFMSVYTNPQSKASLYYKDGNLMIEMKFEDFENYRKHIRERFFAKAKVTK
jgi:hypothetical protein